MITTATIPRGIVLGDYKLRGIIIFGSKLRSIIVGDQQRYGSPIYITLGGIMLAKLSP